MRIPWLPNDPHAWLLYMASQPMMLACMHALHCLLRACPCGEALHGALWSMLMVYWCPKMCFDGALLGPCTWSQDYLGLTKPNVVPDQEFYDVQKKPACGSAAYSVTMLQVISLNCCMCRVSVCKRRRIKNKLSRLRLGVNQREVRTKAHMYACLRSVSC